MGTIFFFCEVSAQLYQLFQENRKPLKNLAVNLGLSFWY